MGLVDTEVEWDTAAINMVHTPTQVEWDPVGCPMEVTCRLPHVECPCKVALADPHLTVQLAVYPMAVRVILVWVAVIPSIVAMVATVAIGVVVTAVIVENSMTFDPATHRNALTAQSTDSNALTDTVDVFAMAPLVRTLVNSPVLARAPPIPRIRRPPKRRIRVGSGRVDFR